MTLAVIQARMGSSRLPGKVLADVAGRPLLWYVVRRLQLATRVDQVVVAVPDTVEDLAIAKWCATWNVPCVAGPEHDVLARFQLIAQQWQPKADVLVRITADCPLIDPAIIDSVVSLIDDSARVAYASNIFPARTFPDGLDVEAFPLRTLEELDEFATDAGDREHVTALLHRSPKLFVRDGRTIRTVRFRPSLAAARWTVDVQEDLDFVKALFEDIRCPWDASMQQIIERTRRRVLLPGELN